MMNEKVIDKVLADILAEMEKGVVAWEMPYFNWSKKNLVTKKPYRGINKLILAQFADEYYLTFNQAKSLGGSVKKGAKGIPIVFWTMLEPKKDENAEVGDEVKEKKIPLMRYYIVFKASDCNGIEIPKAELADVKPMSKCEAFIKNTKADVRHNEDGAFYSPNFDYINVPPRKTFKSTAWYYLTMFHELAHWTGYKTRLDRLTETNSMFGSEVYSKEELTAEIASAVLGRNFGISDIKHNAGYCQSWLKALRNDKSMLIGASSRAEKAVEYLEGLQK